MNKIKKVIKIIFFINIFIFFGPNKLCAEDVHSQLLKALNSNYPLEMTFKQEYDDLQHVALSKKSNYTFVRDMLQEIVLRMIDSKELSSNSFKARS